MSKFIRFVLFFSFEFRADFKFFSEMDEIFRRELKVDRSVTDTSVTDEPDDYTHLPAQKKGETLRQSTLHNAMLRV